MKKVKMTFLMVFLTSSLFAQVNYSVIFSKTYKELPFNVRIENSGIYGISNFDIKVDSVYLYDFDQPKVYKYYKDNYSGYTVYTKNKFNDIKKIFTGPTQVNLVNKSGVLDGSGNDKISVDVNNRSQLTINCTLKNFAKHFTIGFPNDLAYANLIGIDQNGIFFFLIERYIQEIPLKVKREVYTIDGSGKVLSILPLPDVKYLYTINDLQIDSEGSLYQLYSDDNKVEIIKWSGLTRHASEIIKYPEEYNFHLHFNEVVPVSEPASDQSGKVLSPSNRADALRIGEKYVYHKFYCTSDNLAPTAVQAPDGDWVRTPPRLVEGNNARVAYKWGGFNTVAQYDVGLAGGKFAGDIHTDGVSSYAVGVDCSGFVSRCWQLSYHASTSYMPSITNQYPSWDDLKPGDAIHKVGHVRLFVAHNQDGSLKVVESSGRDWGVSYWTYTPYDLTSYSPRNYTQMENEYSENQPSISSATIQGNSVEIKWQCDTTDVVGYRLYKSTDGINWNLFMDENSLTSNSLTDNVPDGQIYYRVSSVKNNPPAYSESNLSNIMGAGKFSNSEKYLIVDGFERENGSWRGPGQNFLFMYGNALNINSTDFEMVKNSEVISGEVNLNNYKGVFWVLGDESTVDETFDSTEQHLVKSYMESGGALFVSGSEIGWDLYNKGNADDKFFYQNYLKAKYLSDDALSDYVNGLANTALDNCSFYFGQTYEEDYPDEISPNGGSQLCMKYANNKGSGIQYSGNFGSSNETAELIYLAFPLETTADDIAFNRVITQSIEYFNTGITSLNESEETVLNYKLEQNYPNPFNPTTTIHYSVAETGFISLKIYDLLGEEVAVLVNEVKQPGNYDVVFNGNNLSAGVYFYKIQAGIISGNGAAFTSVKKLILLK